MRPRVVIYRTLVRAAAPQAIATALGLGWLYGKAIRGDNGTVRSGYPALGARNKYAGYARPPQIFTGYTARRVAGGSIRAGGAGLPSTNAPPTILSSPLQQALATVTSTQTGNR
jgi:hypothetical protein